MSDKKKYYLELSVHQLVDFLLRAGDIDSRVFNSSSMKEGTLIHALYQSKQGPKYISEYYLQHTFHVDNVTIQISGKADGIIEKNTDTFIIDEIKSTVIDLNEFKEKNLLWHLGQAKTYAYMFMCERKLKKIGVRLTYIKQGNIKERLIDEYSYNFEDLDIYIHDLLNEYLNFYNVVFRHIENRNATITNLKFPYENYRKGQRELAKYSYAITKKGGRLFVEAPTGIGKTMSTLYPFVKSLNDDEKSKIFYLTAKSSGKLNAAKAMEIMSSKGLIAKSITITAKDKICFCKDKGCNPDECPFAKNYYCKIKSIVKESLLLYDTFDLETINHIAKEYSVCPFELELDLSLFCDVIICDYNYLFDPISYMKRYFDTDSSHYLALIDEAHNLVDRSRKMYSVSLLKSTFDDARKSLKHISNRKIKTVMAKLKKMFNEFELLNDGENELFDINSEHYRLLNKFTNVYIEENKNHHSDITNELLDLYLEINKFVKICDLFDDNYLYYINKDKNQISVNLVCLDASKFLRASLNSIKGSVIFSATLSPIDYYVDLLGGYKDKDPCLSLSSPFNKDNLRVLIAPKVSTKYKNRDSSYKEVAEYITSFIGKDNGNYFIYFPSYEYLDQILKVLHFPETFKIHIQSRNMDEIQRNAFLDYFETNPTSVNIGMAIMGGSFSEGIDLVNDRLSKVLIVGIGLPKINYESNKIAQLYDFKGLNGYDYAYLYPGMNKIMQAIGRLIRSENDKGEVLLIDERYMIREYQELYHKQYPQYEVLLSAKEYTKKM